METIVNLFQGFQLIFTPTNLLFLMIGIMAGTIVGMFPGIGSASTIAILIPFLYGMNPVTGIVMLCGIYFSATYSSAIVAILLRIPGDPSAVMTLLDGHELAKQGKANIAIAIASISSFIGATLSVIGLMLIAPAVVNAALSFGPAEYFSLIVLALTLLALIGSEAFLKGLLSVMLGLLIGTIGAEPIEGYFRYSFGITILLEGIKFIPITVGLFAVGDALINIEKGVKYKVTDAGRATASKATLLQSAKDVWLGIKKCKFTLVRSSLIGFFTGVLPGAGATVACFFAYITEKRFSKTPEKFGTGMIEAVAAPEAANSSSTGGSMIPMLTLGIPGSKSTALMLVGLLIMGMRPGPLLLERNPDFFWAVIAGLYTANFIILLVIMPFATLVIARIISMIPYTVLYPIIILLASIGSYNVNYNIIDVYLCILFGLIGYLLWKVDIPPAPLIIAVILGPMFETYFMQSMIISMGDPSIFIKRPMSLTILLITAAVIISHFYSQYVKPKKKAVAKL